MDDFVEWKNSMDIFLSCIIVYLAGGIRVTSEDPELAADTIRSWMLVTGYWIVRMTMNLSSVIQHQASSIQHLARNAESVCLHIHRHLHAEPYLRVKEWKPSR
jgi:hypothetical protein